MQMWQDNAIQLVSMPRFFMNIESCGHLGKAVKEFSSFVAPLKGSRITSLDPILLSRIFPIFANRDSMNFDVNVPFLARLLSSLIDEPDIFQDCQEKLSSVALSHHALASKLSLLCSWRKCIDVVLRISKTWQSSSSLGGPSNTGALQGGTNGFLSSTGETARVFHENLVIIEQTQMNRAMLVEN